jgi:hypothetical protein
VKRHTLISTALVVAAVLAAIAPLPPRLVESLYASRLYPAWQPVVTRVSNLTPIAWLDLLIVVVAVAWIAALVRDVWRRGWAATIVRAALRTIVWASAAYLLFLVAWGLNYRRAPLVETLAFDAGSVSAAHAIDVANGVVLRLNALHDAAHEAVRDAPRDAAASVPPIDPVLAAAYARTLADLGRPATFVPARPKRTFLDLYFRRAGVEGMTDPYFLETLMVGDLLPVERPFIIAHEWSHLAGVTDEGEASFVGWLTCLRGAPVHQYSAALFLYAELAAALRPRDRAPVAARLALGPRADLTAIARRGQQNVSPRLASAGWRVYDEYLKANRVERGTASYDEVVRLVLGVRMSPDGVPLRRSAP